MNIVYFTHSLVSCWNHGNAHFQRGVLRALRGMGHHAVAWEKARAWSRKNLNAEQGNGAETGFSAAFPTLEARIFDDEGDLERAVDGAGLVIVHEWNEPSVVAALGRLRRHAGFTLLFHDTHHRAVSEPDAIRRYDLSEYDGVLAFGETLAGVYRKWGWDDRVFVWHEAADTALFKPPCTERAREGIIWIGNWGDGERTAELENFLLRPSWEADLGLDIHGVRYPDQALEMLRCYGARYHGWIANAAVPTAFARHAMTVHVPRRFYTQSLPGIPTIRVFEALACGIPLVCAPWDDCEGLFRAGEDFLVAHTGVEMRAHMAMLARDTARARELAASGLEQVRARHSCDIRARELLAIVQTLMAVA